MNVLTIICAKYLFVINLLLVAWVWWHITNQERRTLVLRAVIVGLVAIVLARAGGALYNEPRPFVAHHFAPLIPHEADNGFPSDHTLLVFACFFLIVPFEKRAAGPAALVAVTVGLARVACGLHSWLDIVTSIVMGATAGYLACLIIREKVPISTETEVLAQEHISS